jgi:hypothetical protein
MLGNCPLTVTILRNLCAARFGLTLSYATHTARPCSGWLWSYQGAVQVSVLAVRLLLPAVLRSTSSKLVRLSLPTG